MQFGKPGTLGIVVTVLVSLLLLISLPGLRFVPTTTTTAATTLNSWTSAPQFNGNASCPVGGCAGSVTTVGHEHQENISTSSLVGNNSATTPIACPTCNQTPLGPGVSQSAGGASGVSRVPGTHPASWTGGTYWFKSYYAGPNYTATYITQVAYFSVLVPASAPASGDQYAILLNEMDSLGYYDQIGLSSDYGCTNCHNSADTWTVAIEQGTYSSTGGCAYSYVVLNRDEASGKITPDNWYTFVLYTSGTNLVFELYSGQGNMNGTALWSTTSADTASSLEIAPAFGYCHGGGAGTGSLSNVPWEEVAGVGTGFSQNVPRWDFPITNFVTAYYSNHAWADIGFPDSDQYEQDAWPAPKPTVPQGYGLDYSQSPSEVLVANLPYYLTFSSYTSSTPRNTVWSINGAAISAGLARTYSNYYHWNDYCLNNTCSDTMTCSNPWPWYAGWGGSYQTVLPMASGYPTYSLSVPSNATLQVYYVGCTVTMTSTTPNEAMTWVIALTVT